MKLDKKLEIAALLMLIPVLGYALFLYLVLPETIAIHFDAAGNPDGYGSKSTVFILPGIYLLLQFLMSVMAQTPELLNAPVKLTEENKERQLQFGKRFMQVLRIVIGLVFLGIDYAAYGFGEKSNSDLPTWFLPFILVLLFAPLIWYFIAARRLR